MSSTEADRERPWRDEDEFYSMYIESDETVPEIARIWNCSTSTIRHWRKKHDLPERDGTGSIPELDDEEDEDTTPVEEMDRLVFMKKGEIANEIADEVGFDYDPERTTRTPNFLRDDLRDIIEYLIPNWWDRFDDDWTREWVLREEFLNVLENELDVTIDTSSDNSITREGMKTLHRIIVQDGGDV